jgi:Flp pilus assembly protein TadD
MLTLGGAACWQVGHWRTNSAMFRRAVALAGERAGALMAPRLAGSFHADGRNLLELGRYPEAAEAFRSAVEFGATDISVHAGLVECHTRLGERDRALREFEQLLKLRPATADDHLQLGLAAFAVGRLDEAITGFTEATRLRPNWSDGYNNLGIALASRGRLQEARDAFARAVQLDPGKPGFLDNLRRAEAMLSGGR